MTIVNQYLGPFVCEPLKIEFLGANVFSLNDKYFLINSTGYIIIIDESLFKELSEQRLDKNLAVKLLQRNMAAVLSCDEKRCFDKIDFLDIEPEFFMIDMTNRCNMACSYCLRKADNATISDSVIDDICQYITDYCVQTGRKHISIQPWGGEPLLCYEKILRIIGKLRDKPFKVHMSIETNGTLLSDEMVESLCDNGVHIGISLDGYEALHNMQRPLKNGENSFYKTIQGLQKLQAKFGDNISTLITVTKNTAPYIQKIVAFFAKELRVKYIKVNFVHASCFHDNSELCLSENEIGQSSAALLDTLIDLNGQGYKISEYNIKVKLSNIVYRNRNDCCISRGCNGGRKLIAIDSEGWLYPCDLTDFPQERIGNIYNGKSLTQNVADAIQKHQFFAKRTSEKCVKCPWHFFCRGGCVVNIDPSGKQPEGTDSIECTINNILYPRLIQLILEKPDLADILIVERNSQ